MTEIIEAVKSVGFPIVMCLLLFYQSVIVIRANTKALVALEKKL